MARTVTIKGAPHCVELAGKYIWSSFRDPGAIEDLLAELEGSNDAAVKGASAYGDYGT